MVHKRRYNTPLRGGDKFWMELYFLLSLFWRSQKLRKTACNHGRLVEDISLILVHLTWWITGHLHQQKPLIGRLHQAWNYYCLPKSIGCSLDTFASVFLVGQKTSPKHGGSSQFLVVFITMDHGDHFRPPSGNVGPLPWPNFMASKWGEPNQLRDPSWDDPPPAAVGYRKVGFLGLRRPTWRFENSFQWCRGLGCFGSRQNDEVVKHQVFRLLVGFLAWTSPHTGLLCVEVIYWCLLLVLGLRFEMSCQVMIAPLPSFFGDERYPYPSWGWYCEITLRVRPAA